MNPLPYSDTPISKLVDGGYLTWAHGAMGFRSWLPVKGNYTMRAGALICLDSRRSYRKEFFPDYKSHRKEKREQRQVIHDKVIFFQQYIREDPMIRTWEEEGLEADDLLAILVPKYKYPIIAIDKDLLQIPKLNIHKIDGTEVTIEHFASRQAKKIRDLVRTPEDILLILTLLGDKSDDIPRLIPPRNLDLLWNLMQSSRPWVAAHQLFKKDLLTNLYLAVLPSPWCYDPIPSPEEVYESICLGTWPSRILRDSIQEFLSKNKKLLK